MGDVGETCTGMPWPPLRDAIMRRIAQNVHSIDPAPCPILHRAAPLAPVLRELREAAGDASTDSDAPRASSAAVDLLVDEYGITPQDQQDFYPAKRAPPNEDAPTWDTLLQGADLEREESRVYGMLNDFPSAPPFTIQRLAELVTDPQRYYHTRAKYLGALRRVLAVTATANAVPPLNDGGDDVGDDRDAHWPFQKRAALHGDTMLTPIPWAVGGVGQRTGRGEHDGSEGAQHAQDARATRDEEGTQTESALRDGNGTSEKDTPLDQLQHAAKADHMGQDDVDDLCSADTWPRLAGEHLGERRALHGLETNGDARNSPLGTCTREDDTLSADNDHPPPSLAHGSASPAKRARAAP
ncbi:hypothetical protein MSPP1_004147 [Malassezia sp. CBS 17886]|nr:hypothetical protein MSPP1_004147 [Malassezia sp. CBS 17886]